MVSIPFKMVKLHLFQTSPQIAIIINGITTANDYYLSVLSGICGNTERFSDTVSNIYLSLNNPGNGTAHTSWNNPSIDYSSNLILTHTFTESFLQVHLH